MTRWWRAAWIGLGAFELLVACGADAGAETTGQALIYGEDDRREYFELDSVELRDRMERSIVAIVPLSVLDEDGGLRIAPRLGELAMLCEGERYAEQPAAALCTGVLVDWDIVLTAGHCLRAFPPDRLAAVFDYYYAASGELMHEPDAVFPVREIIAEALGRGADDDERLDFGFLRLAHRVAAPREPIPIRIGMPVVGEPLIAVSAPGGVPLKADDGARIVDVRDDARDYFTADTDTSGGSSGGAAVDQRLQLLGILARGGRDYDLTDAGCQVMARVGVDHEAEEQFTYASRALEGLCHEAPGASSLCRADCGDPCMTLARSESAGSSDGCAVRTAQPQDWIVALALLLVAMRRRAHG